jgi:hypothetical protein
MQIVGAGAIKPAGDRYGKIVDIGTGNAALAQMAKPK